MRGLPSFSWVLLAVGSAAWLACSSVPVPTGWTSDFGPTQAGGGADGGDVAPDDTSSPHEGTTDAASSTDAAVDGGAAPPDDPDAAIYATPVKCSSGTQWTQGNQGSASMQPGAACRTCHVVGGSASGKSLDVAGTVYPSAHEPINCNGVNAGVTVVITDVNGTSTSLPVNAAGNFSHNDLFGFGALAKPLTVKVVSGAKQRVMVGAVTDGDCNKCHTESGASLAPGRIMAP